MTLPARESSPRRPGFWFARATRLAFAALLFSSPWMVQWVDVLRRLPPLYSGYTDFFVYPSDLLLVLTLAFGFTARFVSRQGFERGPWYLTYPLIALVGLSFLSALTSVDPALTLYHSFRFLLLLGLYLVLVNIPMPAGWIATPLALAVLIQGGVGILQYASQSSIGLPGLGELLLNPADTGVSILRYDDVRILRAYGLTDHPNLLGGFLAFALIFVLGYYLDSARRVRYLFLVPFAVGITALFYTFSRAAQVSFALGVLVIVLAIVRNPTRRRIKLRDAALAAIVLVGALVLPVLTNQRLIAQRAGQGDAFTDNVGEVRSLVERDVLTESANRVFYQRQLLGVGGGALTLGMYYLDKEFPRNAYDYQPAHLVLLVAAAELGLLGGMIWVWLMAAPLAAMWRYRARLIPRPWVAAIAASVIMLLVVGFFDYYTWFWQAGRLWQWSAWGLLAAAFSVRGVDE